MTLLLLAGCADDDPTARLKAAIDEMETAGEEGRRGDFMDRVAEDFSGQNGRLTKQELENLLRVQILHHTRVSAVVTNLDTTLHGDRATATMNALLAGGPRAWLPESGQLFRIETGWRMNDDGEWQLISAKWDPPL